MHYIMYLQIAAAQALDSASFAKFALRGLQSSSVFINLAIIGFRFAKCYLFFAVFWWINELRYVMASHERNDSKGIIHTCGY